MWDFHLVVLNSFHYIAGRELWNIISCRLENIIWFYYSVNIQEPHPDCTDSYDWTAGQLTRQRSPWLCITAIHQSEGWEDSGAVRSNGMENIYQLFCSIWLFAAVLIIPWVLIRRTINSCWSDDISLSQTDMVISSPRRDSDSSANEMFSWQANIIYSANMSLSLWVCHNKIQLRMIYWGLQPFLMQFYWVWIGM